MLENGINTGRCQRLLDLTTVIARVGHFFVELSLVPFNPKAEVWRRQIRSRVMLNIGKCGCVVNGLLHDLNAKAHHLDHSAYTTGHSFGKLSLPKTPNESVQNQADRKFLTTFSPRHSGIAVPQCK